MMLAACSGIIKSRQKSDVIFCFFKRKMYLCNKILIIKLFIYAFFYYLITINIYL